MLEILTCARFTLGTNHAGIVGSDLVFLNITNKYTTLNLHKTHV